MFVYVNSRCISLQIHERMDDLGRGGDSGSLATGNAGARLGCCVITIRNGAMFPPLDNIQQQLLRESEDEA